MDAKRRVWFVTGTAHGFGREIVRAALQRGDLVVATSRTPQKVAAGFSAYSEFHQWQNLSLSSN